MAHVNIDIVRVNAVASAVGSQLDAGFEQVQDFVRLEVDIALAVAVVARHLAVPRPRPEVCCRVGRRVPLVEVAVGRLHSAEVKVADDRLPARLSKRIADS